MTRAYLLPLDQIERLREAGGPLAEVDLTQLDLEALPVIEVDGSIVAYWPIFYALHLEPLWIAEDHRHQVGRLLLTLMEQTLTTLGKPVAFAVIDPDTPVLALAERLGFDRVPGDLYYVTAPAVPPVEV
jgi:hypothetical protein